MTEQLIALLRAHNATFRVVEHEPTTTSEESARVRGTPLEQGAKAMLFRADGTPLLLVLPANRRVDTRAYKRAQGIKNLQLFSPEELRDLTGLEVGAVPPFGRLIGVPTHADEHLLHLPEIAFNAGSRRVSVIMSTADYVRIEQPTQESFAA
ncbi:MAG TPA: YbaK/EbsC family protein [Chloroflexota bacterium]